MEIFVQEIDIDLFSYYLSNKKASSLSFNLSLFVYIYISPSVSI